MKVMYEIENWTEERENLKAASSQVHVSQVPSFKACVCLKVYQLYDLESEDEEEDEGVEPFQFFLPSWKKFYRKYHSLYSHWINKTNQDQVPQGKKYSLKELVEKVQNFPPYYYHNNYYLKFCCFHRKLKNEAGSLVRRY